MGFAVDVTKGSSGNTGGGDLFSDKMIAGKRGGGGGRGGRRGGRS